MPILIASHKKNNKFSRICKEAAAEMKRLRIPGTMVGIAHGDKDYCAGFGVTSLDNPLPVTEDTLFKLASISKTFLATVVVMLVEKGKIALDVPVKNYVPSLKLKDKKAENSVTMRHLLTHTSGWYGDYFNDFGRGDDALARMVKKMEELPQIAPLGEIFSYCNSGFYLAARVIEVVTGKTYEDAVKKMVFEPLGLKNSFFFSEDVITRRFAAGHVEVNGKIQASKVWGRPRSASPTGGIICSVKDLLRYARFHMGDGTAPDGKRLLSKRSMALLHEPLLPAFASKKVALSWFVLDIGGRKAIWHGGGTIGQASYLQICPSEKFAVVVFANNDSGVVFCEKIGAAAFRDYLGVDISQPKPIEMAREDLAEYTGRYSNPSTVYDIKLEKNGLRAYPTSMGGFPTPKDKPAVQPPPVRVGFYEKDKLVFLEGPSKNFTGEFLRDSGGNVAWLRLSRIMKKEKRHKRI